MEAIKVIDLEVNKEFELVSFDKRAGIAVIESKEYGMCSQDADKLELVTKKSTKTKVIILNILQFCCIVVIWYSSYKFKNSIITKDMIKWASTEILLVIYLVGLYLVEKLEERR